ncbi:MAG: polysaccharide biosynthesis/export family protein [Acidobacteriota bacterium]|nr:polysaccharide biosynthesis/export family protein [Acidobacteriota bacterium]
MSKLIWASAVAIFSLVSVSAQVTSGSVSGQPKDLLRADETLSASRARVLANSRPAESGMESSSAHATSSLNHVAARNVSPLSESKGPAANNTRFRTNTPAADGAALPLALNQIYRIGVGDVLDVQLIDVPSARSTLFTVLEGGVLDYPLSNAPVPVSGLTADEIAEQLRARIKVLENPKVAVKVRDYSSHSVIVTGFVLDPGARFLRREATPLYVVLAEARPQSEAQKATITRAGVPVINIELKDQNSIATLVLPGDVIKVLALPIEPAVFFYTGGALNSPGQKTFHSSLTVTQAILASGGVTRSAGSKVKVSRQGADGRLTTTEYNLRQIEEGKIPDPVLQPGDRIAVAETR